MAQDAASHRADSGASDPPKRRRWQRRAASRRSNLTAEEVAALEQERLRSLRTAGLRIQLTEDERAEIERRAKAYKGSLSKYAREVLLSPEKAPLPPVRDSAAINALAYQLSRIGNNLNQLAKVANENRTVPHQLDLDAISARIVAALEKVYGG